MNPLGDLRRTIAQFVVHYHQERNHQGLGKTSLTARLPSMAAVGFAVVSASAGFSSTTPARHDAARWWIRRLGSLMGHYALEFEIPSPGDAHPAWRRIIDTPLDSPEDLCAWADAPTVPHPTYVVQPRSAVLLVVVAGTADGVGRTGHPQR